jgi:hypothetical protein
MCFQSLTDHPNSDLVPIGPKTLNPNSLGLVNRAVPKVMCYDLLGATNGAVQSSRYGHAAYSCLERGQGYMSRHGCRPVFAPGPTRRA